MVVNGRVVTLDPARPVAEAVAVQGERILAVGSLAETRALGGPNTQVVDAEGGLVVPAFHDAHLHLLSYARARARLDCHQLASLADLQQALRQRDRELPAAAWLRASGYDETRFVEQRHPDCHDLDLAVPDRPVRLQHRSLHLDVLNTAALKLTELAESSSPSVERDPVSREPTGRLYHAAELLRGRLPRPTETELAYDVRQACDRLLAWGITTVQDASITNGVEEWQLFHRLVHRGDLPLRLFVMPGGRHWHDVLAVQPPTARVRLGPVKLVLDEATTDPADLQAAVADVRRAGRAVALHAVSESEVAIALQALLEAGPRRRSAPPDRLEHGATIAESWLPDLRAAGLMVVGQPSLVYQRGDAYLAEHPKELHGWLHRAGSLVAAGVGYAISSDAPLTEPAPGLGLHAARWRRTRAGAVLGVGETLSPEQALAAYTLAPARAAGVSRHLGRLRPGALADLAVLDPDFLEAVTPHTRPARLTVSRGQVVWRLLEAVGLG